MRRLWGVGPKLEETLAKLGVATIGELARARSRPARAARWASTATTCCGSRGARTTARSPPRPDEAKSLGQEHTYDADTREPARLRARCSSSPTASRARLRAHELQARTVTLKYRDEDFRTATHARTLEARDRLGRRAVPARERLFEEVHGGSRVRLVGIYTSNFGEATPQLGLFDAAAEPAKPGKVDRVRDEVARRFGGEAITRASLLGRRERRNPSDKPPR